jgi:hypothetical protein
MSDPDTQKAINETLRNACNRLGDQVLKLNRKLDGNATESLLAERMLAYSHAMRVIARFIKPVHDVDSSDD